MSVSDWEVKVWELGRGTCTTSLTMRFTYSLANMCAISPDGRHVVYCGSESSVVRVASLVGK